jgi:cytochrome c oxidase subunit 3
MPGTVTDEIEIVHSGGGGGNGKGSGPGGGGGGGADGAPAMPQRVYVTGMTIALGGILMFFMALTSAYIVRKGLSTDWRQLALPRVLWLNTVILLASSATIARARRQLSAADAAGFRYWWGVTTALGLLFLGGQLIAWRQLAGEGVYLASNPSSSFFYLLTAAHGVHLLGGVIALLAVMVRATKKLTRATAAEVVSIYWHFMDVLWVFLLLLLYLGR